MKIIKLKPFQENAIDAILTQFENADGSTKMIVKAPTGSGKTITLIGLIERLVTDYYGKYVFCWLTPGSGELEEQSKDKMDRFSSNLQSGTLSDVLTNGFSPNTTYFINWETVSKKGNVAIRDGERRNLFEQVAIAHREGLRFIILIDEEHKNDTKKTQDIISAMNPVREIRVSATPEKRLGIDFYEIPEEIVIAEQLITKALYINKGFDHDVTMFSESNERDILIDAADLTRREILETYQERNEDVNPLVLIQFPSLSDPMIESVERKLESMGYTYENGMVASWFSEENKADEDMHSTKIGKHNLGSVEAEDSITRHNAKPCFLLFKQAIATGWDCPRAKVLVKLRDNMNEKFEVQTLGRLRRMPKAVHYGSDILDCAYLYTFDEKYKEAVIKDGTGFEVKRLKLKPEAKGIKVYKQILDHDVNLVDMKKARKAIYAYIMEKYGLTPLPGNKTANEDNIARLKAYGYKFGTKLHREFIVGKYRTLGEVVRADDTQNLTFEVNTHAHGMLLRHEIGRYSKLLSLNHENMVKLLRILFCYRRKGSLNYKALNLSLREYYAFIINNKNLLYDLFKEFEDSTGTIDTSYIQQKLVAEIKTVEGTILSEEVYPYIEESDSINFVKNVYEGYDSTMIHGQFRSIPERLFEQYCENKSNIKFVYKNGDKGLNYVSLVYQTKIGKTKNFYPDYIVQMTDGTIWVIETKGGETISGVDKNIDIEATHKCRALKLYADSHGFKFGFVRDKGGLLYINRTGKWVSDMNDPCWENLGNVL